MNLLNTLWSQLLFYMYQLAGVHDLLSVHNDRVANYNYKDIPCSCQFKCCNNIVV